MSPKILAASFGERTAPDGSLVKDNFYRWFGQSQAVDKEGVPLALFHGTAKRFDAFDSHQQGSNFEDVEGAFPRDGFWFTDDASNADWYSGVSARLNDGEGRHSLKVYLSLQNPFVVTQQMYSADGSSAIPNQYDLEALGHDGIIVELTEECPVQQQKIDDHVGQMIDSFKGAFHTWDQAAQDELNRLDASLMVLKHTHYVAFRPEQVKSAMGNSGAFNPADPDMSDRKAFALALDQTLAQRSQAAQSFLQSLVTPLKTTTPCRP